MHRTCLRHRGVQLDLFRPLPPRPTWRTLPPAVTQRVQRLLARLLAGASRRASSNRAAERGCPMSEKIKPHHLERKAILYVRQSSSYQVTHNEESRRLQYAMQDRLQQLGWREIEVVDEDLGRSAAGTVTRTGFERMVADVCLGKVGAVAAREGLAVCAQQPRMAAAGGGLPLGRHAADRPGRGLRAAAEQRPSAAGAEGESERIRTGSAAATVPGSSVREGASGRTGRGLHRWGI